jgi:hypothetical protein
VVRVSDFLVNEVDKEGNVVHLKTTEIPKSAKKESKETADQAEVCLMFDLSQSPPLVALQVNHASPANCLERRDL